MLEESLSNNKAPRYKSERNVEAKWKSNFGATSLQKKTITQTEMETEELRRQVRLGGLRRKSDDFDRGKRPLARRSNFRIVQEQNVGSCESNGLTMVKKPHQAKSQVFSASLLCSGNNDQSQGDGTI